MTSGLKVFERPEFGTVRVVEQDGEPWFVGKDVARVLGYPNPSRGSSLFGHVPDEWKKLNIVPTPGGKQKMITLSEQGLYCFIGRSDKPKALPFQEWIAGNVLTATRKTCCDRMPQNYAQALRALADEVEQREARNIVPPQKSKTHDSKRDMGNTYLLVADIPWLTDFFVDCRVVRQHIGKKLAALSEALGYEVVVLPYPENLNSAKAYHRDVVKAFYGVLKRNQNILSRYRY